MAPCFELKENTQLKLFTTLNFRVFVMAYYISYLLLPVQTWEFDRKSVLFELVPWQPPAMHVYLNIRPLVMETDQMSPCL